MELSHERVDAEPIQVEVAFFQVLASVLDRVPFRLQLLESRRDGGEVSAEDGAIEPKLSSAAFQW